MSDCNFSPGNDSLSLWEEVLVLKASIGMADCRFTFCNYKVKERKKAIMTLFNNPVIKLN